MSHIAPSDSEDPGDDQHRKKSKYAKSHGKKAHASASFPSLDENLSEASGGSAVSKDKNKSGLYNKKQVQNFENFENNNVNPARAATYGATATTAASTGVQVPGTGTGTGGRQAIISDRYSVEQPLVFSRPRPPMQQQHQNQNQLPGNQNGGLGAVNVQAPPGGGGGGVGGGGGDGDGDGGDDGRRGRREWKEKCSKLCRLIRFSSIFIVILIFLAGLVSIIVWLTVVDNRNTEPQVTYANLFEVIQLEDMLHLLTKGGANVKVNLTGRVDPKFEEAGFHLSLYRGSCVSLPLNQTLTVNGRAENYQIFGKNTFVSNHTVMLGSSAELNVSFVLSNSTLTNSANFRVYFFKSYEDLVKCYNSEPADTRINCLCFFSISGTGDMPSFSYANGSYGGHWECEDLKEKPFEGQYYFLTKFLGASRADSPSIYDHLFVNFSFTYSTIGVFNPLNTSFTGQECKSLDDTKDNIHEYSCRVDYGIFFTAGRSRCTYLTLATSSYIAPQTDSRFRDIIPITITERCRDDVVVFIAIVVLLAILLVLISYCAPCRLVLKTVQSRCAHRAYEVLT